MLLIQMEMVKFRRSQRDYNQIIFAFLNRVSVEQQSGNDAQSNFWIVGHGHTTVYGM